MSKPPSDDRYARAVELTEEAMRISDETHYETGERLLYKAMTIAPGEEVFIENYMQFCLQVAHNCVIAGEYPEAIVYFRKVLERSSDDPETWMDLGAALAHNDEAIEALGAWQKALALLQAAKVRDKENIATILENVRTVQKALKEAGVE